MLVEGRWAGQQIPTSGSSVAWPESISCHSFALIALTGCAKKLEKFKNQGKGGGGFLAEGDVYSMRFQEKGTVAGPISEIMVPIAHPLSLPSSAHLKNKNKL